MARALVVAALLAAVAAPPARAGREFVAEAADFRCLTDWDLVGKVRIFNPKPRKLRKAKRKLAKILERGRRARLPKGTFIQIVPGEAMVKRGGGFNREGGGWEFFALGVSAAGTEILQRGGAEVQGITGPCQNCHAGAAKLNFVCGEHMLCLPIVFDRDTIFALQNADPRCQPVQ